MCYFLCRYDTFWYCTTVWYDSMTSSKCNNIYAVHSSTYVRLIRLIQEPLVGKYTYWHIDVTTACTYIVNIFRMLHNLYTILRPKYLTYCLLPNWIVFGSLSTLPTNPFTAVLSHIFSITIYAPAHLAHEHSASTSRIHMS